MKRFLPLLAVAALCTSAIGCASSSQLTREQALDRYPHVAALEQRMIQARANELDVLAQDAFERAEDAQERADKAASKDDAEAGAMASEGLAALDEAEQTAARARDVFADVLAARERALEAGASRTNGDFMKAESELARATALLERGNLEKAKFTRPALVQAYGDVELALIKVATVRAARQAIAAAEEAGARKHAPKTLALADENVTLALSVLDASREDRDRADRIATTATYQAQRAQRVTQLVRNFEDQDYTAEDVILWYQGQLDTVAQPLGKPLAFSREDQAVVDGLRADIAALAGNARAMEAQLAAAHTEITQTQATAAQRLTEAERQAEQAERLAVMAQAEAERRVQAELAAEAARKRQEMAAMQARLQGELGSVEAERAAERQRQEAAQKRLDMVQSMFAENEAEVLRKRDDILVRSHGFYFPVGKSEIDSRNFALLNKIITAVEAFPGSRVEVSGHTDTTGSAELNQRLSAERAEKVAQFLIEVGHISPDRIMSVGYGPDRPIAPNTTPEGRTANRRVEVLIQPVN